MKSIWVDLSKHLEKNYIQWTISQTPMTVYHGHKKIKHIQWKSGGRLNKKDGLTRYGNSHVKDKTS